MRPEDRRHLADVLVALGDDELLLAHRDSEWTGHAPILEEDIAFANIALDELGHAALWYRRAAELREEDPETLPDRLAFHRPPSAFRNIRLVELPKGDWAFTIVRQFLFDSAEQVRLKALGEIPSAGLAQTSAKILTEERYHDRHLRAWVRRLALGTTESRRRMQAALDELWPAAQQIFQPLPDEDDLTAAGLWPPSAPLGERWETEVRACLSEAELAVPRVKSNGDAGREAHTVYLEPLLAEMQSVARLEADAEW